MREKSEDLKTSCSSLHIFVLARNEESNIGRCLEALEGWADQVTILDSGSRDGTQRRAEEFAFTKWKPFEYVSHEEAYNLITGSWLSEGQFGLILDADMVLSVELEKEIVDFAEDSKGANVLLAPVKMCWEGRPLRYGSMYPAKPILFRGGQEYFVGDGHGERLRSSAKVALARWWLVHDDRKGFGVFLESQCRYGENLVRRSRERKVSWRHRVRVRSPLFVVISPLWSLLARMGVLSGRLGFVYALDRLISEAVLYRTAMVAKLGGTEQRTEMEK